MTLACFHFLAIRVSMGVCVSSMDSFHFLSINTQEWNYWIISFSPHCDQDVWSFFFLVLAVLTEMRRYLIFVAFIFISQVISDVGHLLLLAIYVSQPLSAWQNTCYRQLIRRKSLFRQIVSVSGCFALLLWSCDIAVHHTWSLWKKSLFTWWLKSKKKEEGLGSQYLLWGHPLPLTFLPLGSTSYSFLHLQVVPWPLAVAGAFTIQTSIICVFFEKCLSRVFFCW